jgi:penicillin-binding protein 1A
VHYSKRFGVYDDLLPVLAMSLGAGETTLAKLAAGYATFVNGGKQVKYTLIDRVQDRWGKTIWSYDDRKCTECSAEKWEGQAEPTLPPDNKKQIIDPHTAYQMTSMMEGVVQRGTGSMIRRILGPNVPVAGKTGTTNDEKDAWFVGFTPDLVVGVFIGYDTPRPMGKGMTGGTVAAPIFAHFLKQALVGKLAVPFRQPPDIRLVRVSLRTGLKATPGEKETVLEAFKPEEEPDDEYSVIGFTNESGTFITPDQADPRTAGSGKGLF